MTDHNQADKPKTREQFREILRAAGRLSTAWDDIDGTGYETSEADLQAAQAGIPDDGWTVRDAINDERGE